MKQKAAILKALVDDPIHLTTVQVCEIARGLIPDICKATVCRNLRILSRDGVVMRLNLNGSPDNYKKMQSDQYHFQCEKWKPVIDLDEPVNKEIEKEYLQKLDL